MERNNQPHNTQTYNDLWQPFTGRPFAGNHANRVRVTIDKRNSLFLNKAAFVALGEPRAIELLFSKKLNAIGIKPSDLRNESSFPVKPRIRKKNGDGKPYGFEIRAAAFMQHHNFMTPFMVLFNKITVMPDGMMHLPLAYVTRVSRGAR